MPSHVMEDSGTTRNAHAVSARRTEPQLQSLLPHQDKGARAVVGQAVVRFPAQVPQPGRVLIAVETAARLQQGISGEPASKRIVRLVRSRLYQVPDVLVHDGMQTLLRKAVHMFRREQADFYHDLAGFTGRVIADLSSNPLPAGTLVAGFSLTHPGLCEQVVARRGCLWTVNSHAHPDDASLGLWGGLLSSALDLVEKEGAVQIIGEGRLADLAFALARHRAIPLDAKATSCIVVSRINTPQHATPARAIGIDLPETLLREMFPQAAQYSAFDLKGMLFNEDTLLDLYYPDGDLIYPEWFQPASVGRFLDDLAYISHTCPPTVPASQQKLGEGITVDRLDSRTRLFRFENPTANIHVRPVPSQNTNVRPKRADGIGLSLIGGGRWPLGMVVRRVASDPRIDLRGICDRRPEAAYLAGEALPFAWTSTRPEDAFEDKDTDAIAVAPYHGMHAPFAAAVLRAGKHCFVEKPPVINQEQLDDLKDAACHSDKLLYVGYNRRFAPLNDRIGKLLSERQGPIFMNFVMRAVDVPRYDWYHWASNGNRILSNVCHIIDYSLYLAAPALPVTVTATTAIKGREDENVIVTICFDDGSMANLVYTNKGKVAHGYFQRYLIAKDDLFIEVDGFASMVARASSKVVDRWKGVLDMGHRRQMKAFGDALATNGPSPICLRDTLISAQTVVAAAQAAQLGRPVTLNLAPYLNLR
ncbi:MAG: Gfo/Idh/MocA family oxidoreductase [Planctomycetales bacterium]